MSVPKRKNLCLYITLSVLDGYKKMLFYMVKRYFKYQAVNRCRIRNSLSFVLKLVPIDWIFNDDAKNVLQIDQNYLGSLNITVSCEVVFSPLHDVYIRHSYLKG